MKLLLISSSPRKKISQTFLLAGQVLKGCAKEGVKTEIIHLSDLSIKFCDHCEACHKNILCCHLKDDVGAVLNKMLQADGIILASPNYINQITASMKAIFDRSSHFIHCKRLLGKYIAGVVSSGSGQDKEVLNYIEYYGHTCGAQYIGGISSRAPIDDKKKGEAFNLGKIFIAAIKDKRVFPEQAKIIEAGKEHFKIIMEMRKDIWKEEYQYWKDKGWL